MSFKDTALIIVWCIIVLASVTACYKVYVVDTNYPLVTFTACDPAEESCFALQCDEESEAYDEYLCQGREAGETTYFAYIKKQKNQIESCDARFEDCEALRCEAQEFGCEYITCNEGTLSEYAYEGVVCDDVVMSSEVPTTPVEMEESSAPKVEMNPEPVLITPDTTETAPAANEELIPSSAPAEAPVIEQPNEAELPEPTHNLPI